ncbi:hypothetical protein ACFX1Q_040986 [Malus domestica]
MVEEGFGGDGWEGFLSFKDSGVRRERRKVRKKGEIEGGLYLFSPAIANLLPLQFDRTPSASFAQLFVGGVISCINGSLDDDLWFSFSSTAEKSGID